MAASSKRPPLIGPGPGGWQVRWLRPGAREWAWPGLRCCRELEPGSSQLPAGRSQASPPLHSVQKRASTPLARSTRFDQMNSLPLEDCSSVGAVPHQPETVPPHRTQGAYPEARAAVPRSRPTSCSLPTHDYGL